MMYIFLLDSEVRINLYLSIGKYIEENLKGSNVIYLSTDLYVEKLLKKRNKNSQGIHFSKGEILVDNNVINTIEYTLGKVDINKANEIYSSSVRAIESLLSTDEVYLFGANGNHLIDLAIRNVSERYVNVYSLFSEMSNIPGRTFFDSLGSNARSNLYKNSRLNKGCVRKYVDWRDGYVNNPPIKQKVSSSSRFNLINKLLLSISSDINRLINPHRGSYYNMLRSKIRNEKQIEWEYDTVDKGENYIFYPMQLSSDSQLKLNSSIDNYDAIKLIFEKNKDIVIYIKPHPAEYDHEVKRKLTQLKKKYGFKIVSGCTIELCKNAVHIYTINSTVGLEAKILECDVTFLGKSFYSNFSSEDLMNYILNHLVEIDFFSGKYVDIYNEFNKILNHARKKN